MYVGVIFRKIDMMYTCRERCLKVWKHGRDENTLSYRAGEEKREERLRYCCKMCRATNVVYSLYCLSFLSCPVAG